jgi:hypothetical protein
MWEGVRKLIGFSFVNGSQFHFCGFPILILVISILGYLFLKRWFITPFVTFVVLWL